MPCISESFRKLNIFPRATSDKAIIDSDLEKRHYSEQIIWQFLTFLLSYDMSRIATQ